MSLSREIVTYCRRNRVSSTEASDAIGKSGVIDRFQPVGAGQYAVGPIRSVFTSSDSNFELHEQLEAIEEGEVVVVFTSEFGERAVLGQLISKYVLLYRGATALVVQGYVRDAAAIRRDGWSVWSLGFTPLGCSNAYLGSFPHDEVHRLRETYDGGVAVCDDGGVTLLPRRLMTHQTLQALEEIEAQEDLWFYCLDTLKWSTSDIVVGKRYLTDVGSIPKELLTGLEK